MKKKLRKKFLKNLQNFAPKNFSIKKCTGLTEKIYNNQIFTIQMRYATLH